MELTLKINTQELKSQVIALDRKSYAQLYQLYARKVYNSVYRVTNNYAITEDIVQDAFCTAFEQREYLRNVEKFEGWVKRIALNKAISYLRKNKLVFVEENNLDMPSDEACEEEEMLLLKKVEDIKAAIESLPDGYRTIVVLHLFEDISQKDIAGILNISHSTVRSQYHRAKKKIISTLKEKYDERK